MGKRPDDIYQMDIIFIFNRPFDLAELVVPPIFLGLISYAIVFLAMYAQCCCIFEITLFTMLGNMFVLFAVLLTIFSKLQTSKHGLTPASALCSTILLGLPIGWPIYLIPSVWIPPFPVVCISFLLIPLICLIGIFGNLVISDYREAGTLERLNRDRSGLPTKTPSYPSRIAKKYYSSSGSSGNLATHCVPIYFILAIMIIYPIMLNVEDCYSHRETPTATMLLNQTADGNYTLITMKLTDPVELDAVYIQILDRNRAFQYGEDLDHLNLTQNSSSFVYFSDNDNDGLWTVGDEFRVASMENGGVAEDGYIIRFVFDPTNKSIASVIFD